MMDGPDADGCSKIVPVPLNGPPVVREVILDCGCPHLALVKLEYKLQNLHAK